VKTRLLTIVCTLSLLTAACGGEPVEHGFYSGEHVTFQVLGLTAVTDLRLSGMECRVPFPDNDLLSICRYQAPGFLVGEFPIDGGEFVVSTGGVTLHGSFDNETASGTWALKKECTVEYLGVKPVCQASGTWSSTYQYSNAPPEPDISVDTDGLLPEDSVVHPIDVGPLDRLTIEGIPEPATGASATQVEANNYLNSIRIEVGVAVAVQHDALNAAAQAHADYYAGHAGKYASAQLSPHSENAEWADGFSGASVGDRCAHHGWDGGWSLWEVMHFISNPTGAIDGWLDSLYHRIPLIHPNTERWGYGMSQGDTGCDVIDGSYGKALIPVPARWPLPEHTIRHRWEGNESPQPPLAEGESYPSGPIVTITYPKGTVLKLNKATLTDQTGNIVPAQVQTPENDSWLSETWALYAYSPLQTGEAYTVTFVGSVAGIPVEESWWFLTQ
jgi:uncharacterized protein YkwD